MAQLKIYEAKESRNAWIPGGAEALLDVRGAEQGDWWIVAHTATEAMEIAQAAGLPYADNGRKLRVWGRSDTADAIRQAGYLTTPGEVIVFASRRGNKGVARFFKGEWTLVGRFEYVPAARKQLFIPEGA